MMRIFPMKNDSKTNNDYSYKINKCLVLSFNNNNMNEGRQIREYRNVRNFFA